MDLLNKIRASLDEMTTSERYTASYCLEHTDDFAFYTLDRIAAEIKTSTTTVIRFCRRLGFRGFKDFQDALRVHIRTQLELPDKFQQTMDSSSKNDLLTQTIQRNFSCIQNTFRKIPFESLNQAVHYIVNAKRVFTFGMKESFAQAHYTYTRLLAVRDNVFILNAGYDIESILSLRTDDICIVYCFPRYVNQSLQVLQILKEHGIPTILVTSEPYDRLKTYATLILPCHVDIHGIKNSAVASICLSDYLCNAVALQNGDNTMKHLKDSEVLFKMYDIIAD